MKPPSTIAYLEEAERRGALGRGLIEWHDCGCSICAQRFGLRPLCSFAPVDEEMAIA